MNALLYMIIISSVFGGFQIFNFGKFGIQPVYIFIFLFTFAVLLNFIMGKVQFHISSKIQILLPFMLTVASAFSFFYVLSFGYPEYVIQFLKTYLHFIFLCTFSICLSLMVFKPQSWKNVAKIWIVLSILINAFGVYQLFARAFDLPLAWIDMTNASLTSLYDTTEPYKQLSLQFQNFYRATSIFSEPSSLASFNLYTISFMVFPLFINKHYKLFKNRLILNSAFVIALIGLFVTFSLTGFVGLMIIILAYLYSVKQFDIKRILYYLVITAIFIFIADIIVEEYFKISILDLFYQRISSILGLSNQAIVGESFGTRADNFRQSFEGWLISPLFGIGMGQTKNITGIGYSDYGVMHSLMETGFVGGIIFISLLVLLFIRFNTHIRNLNFVDDDYNYLTYMGFFISIILIFKNFIVSNMFINWELWLFIGTCGSILNMLQYKKGYKVETINFFKKKPHQIIDRV